MKIFNPFENMTEEELNTWNEIAINSKFDAQREHIYGKNRIRRMQRRAEAKRISEFRAGDTIKVKVTVRGGAEFTIPGKIVSVANPTVRIANIKDGVKLRKAITKLFNPRNKKTKTSTKLKNLRRKYI